ncbi:MAG: nucleotidyltransferase family protein [Candidatus Daviesbacteria bacterium]
MARKIKSAIILAGGKGERLRPYTNDRPKPMVEIAGKPILAYQINELKKAGVEEIILACSYQREVLQSYLSDGEKYKIKASYSIEETPLGRGGGIKQAMKQITGDWDDVIISNGDNLWRVDLKSLIKKHQEKRALATIVVVPLKSPYGIVEFNENDEILGFREKPELPHWINAGIYVFSKNIELLLPDIGDHEVETFPKLPKEKFLVFQSRDYWRGIDTVKDLTEAEKEVKEIFTSF